MKYEKKSSKNIRSVSFVSNPAFYAELRRHQGF